MEPRVARLEVDISYIKADVGEIKLALKALQADVTSLRVDNARIDERTKHLPTHMQMLAMLGILLGLVSAVTVFQDNIKRVFSFAPPSVSSIPAPPSK
jgi:hypothetical protein